MGCVLGGGEKQAGMLRIYRREAQNVPHGSSKCTVVELKCTAGELKVYRRKAQSVPPNPDMRRLPTVWLRWEATGLEGEHQLVVDDSLPSTI
jgi:hypothetical protein